MIKHGVNVEGAPLTPLGTMSKCWRHHWQEYAMEGAQLGIFMLSAGIFTALLEWPTSPFCTGIPNEFVRRWIIGVAMGGTAVALIYSPWGKRTGAHMNPAVTLTFLRLGKIDKVDALYYIVFQFLGGLAGAYLMVLLMGHYFTDTPTTYVVTVPGPDGVGVAFAGEFLAAVGMMTMILFVSNHPSIANYTGLFAGILIMCYVTFEAPLSGFGMNPARTFASTLPSGIWTALWIYFVAPPLGMLLAAQFYLRVKCGKSIFCGKLKW